MSIVENASNDICVCVLSGYNGFKLVIRKYTLRDSIAGSCGGYKVDHNDILLKDVCSFEEAYLKAIAAYGKIYKTRYNYIDPPELFLKDLKEF